jgi:hypothetical protein
MNVEVAENGKGGWQVEMDGAYHVNFPSQAEAEAFAERLRARLNAPHPLPDLGEIIADLSNDPSSNGAS